MATAFLSRHHRARFGGQCLYVGWLLALFCHMALAADGRRDVDSAEVDRPRLFDIDRLPLRQALEAFLRTAGQSLLYDDAITAGKEGGPLRGELTPEAALRALLAGTGLIAKRTAPSAWMLLDERSASGSAGEAPDLSDGLGLTTDARAYYGALQSVIGRALCGDPLTTPGGYRMALRIWVGPDNVIERVLLHPTGDAARDQRVLSRLKGLRISVPLPPGIDSPVTLVILPRMPAQSGDCALTRALFPDAA